MLGGTTFERGQTMIARILCPTDFSETAQYAYEYTLDFAAQIGAEIVLAHAFDVPETYDMQGQTHPANHELEQRLASLEAPAAARLVRVLHAGSPGEVICWLCQERQCDLIILGTDSQNRLKHLLFGSTADYVLRHARCPVLAVRKVPAGEPPIKEPTVLPVPAPRFM